MSRLSCQVDTSPPTHHPSTTSAAPHPHRCSARVRRAAHHPHPTSRDVSALLSCHIGGGVFFWCLFGACLVLNGAPSTTGAGRQEGDRKATRRDDLHWPRRDTCTCDDLHPLDTCTRNGRARATLDDLRRQLVSGRESREGRHPPRLSACAHLVWGTPHTPHALSKQRPRIGADNQASDDHAARVRRATQRPTPAPPSTLPPSTADRSATKAPQ